MAEWLEDHCHDEPRFWYEVVKPIVRSLRAAPAAPAPSDEAEKLRLAMRTVATICECEGRFVALAALGEEPK